MSKAAARPFHALRWLTIPPHRAMSRVAKWLTIPPPSGSV